MDDTVVVQYILWSSRQVTTTCSLDFEPLRQPPLRPIYETRRERDRHPHSARKEEASMRFRAESLMNETTIATAIEIQVDHRFVVAIVKASVFAGLAVVGIA